MLQTLSTNASEMDTPFNLLIIIIFIGPNAL